MKMTRKILEKKLQNLCNEMGIKFGIQEGDWNFDYNSTYGGYKVVEIMERGGESHPLLNKRLTAERMGDCLDMAIAVAWLHRTRE